jgi:hypothetical protein
MYLDPVISIGAYLDPRISRSVSGSEGQEERIWIRESVGAYLDPGVSRSVSVSWGSVGMYLDPGSEAEDTYLDPEVSRYVSGSGPNCLSC